MSLDWERLIDRIIRSDLARPDQIVGCSEAEIKKLETAAGLHLPASYRGFLKRMGHGAGDLFRGTDMFYSHLAGNLRPWAEKLLANERPGLRLPADAFVFSIHQGYEVCYFLAGEGDDPPIYQFVEGQGAPTRPWDNFSAFLEEGIATHEHMM